MARNSLARINVVDIEATCWEGDPPVGQVSEIIEIGVVAIDLPTLAICQLDTLLVKPTNSVVSEFCTNLTGITQEEVENGVSFATACRRLEDIGSNRHTWASYGDYDRKMFTTECQRKNVPYPFGSRHINVKTLAGITMGLSHEVGMEEMLRRMRMDLIGEHHRAVDDANNIARILRALLQRIG